MKKGYTFDKETK